MTAAAPLPRATATAPPPRFERARGTSRTGFAFADGETRLATLFQAGSAKVRLPRVHGGEPPLAVLLNTAGGLTGGDRLSIAVAVGAGATAVATTQAAERLYRSIGGAATIDCRLTVGAGARLDWLPQETIVFDGAALDRTTTIELAPGARLLALESFVLGRAAMGERVRRATLADRWRITRDGRLVFADALRLDGDATEILAGPATGGGGAAFATLVVVEPDGETALASVRAALDACGLEAGASRLDEIVVARLVAADGTALRNALTAILTALRGRPPPRVWSC